MDEIIIVPEIGDYVCPDYWAFGDELKPGDAPVDSCWPGCQFRCGENNVPMNITVTGKGKRGKYGIWYRCRIEFPRDGEPSEFSGGKLLKKDYPGWAVDVPGELKKKG